MYLNELSEQDKKKFLELVYKTGNVDNDFSSKEINILNHYKKEMGIAKIPVTSTRDALVDYFAGCSILVRKIVMFELFGMVLADFGVLSEQESNFMDSVIEKFALPQDVVTDLRDVAEALEKAYSAAHEAVFN